MAVNPFYLITRNFFIFVIKWFVMAILKGDKELEHAPTLRQKALQINLSEHIYGTFAEIGAGQETVRHFFRAGFFR